MEQKNNQMLCPVRKKCGGCTYMGESYERQLQDKQYQLETLLSKYGTVEPIIGMEFPYYYRNKVHAVFSFEKGGKVVAGTYQEGTHKVVPVERCLIDNQKSDAIIQTIKGLLKSFKIKTYDEDTGYGLLRHVLIRSGFTSGEIMVVLVCASPILPSKNNFVKALRKEHPEISTVVLNVNDLRTNMVLGPRNITLYGKGFIVDKLLSKTFSISPSAFYQVNPVQTKVLYKTAIEYAALSGKETVLDTYCGIGTIGMIASDQAGKVIGVELNPESIKDARNNAKHNDVKNIQFVNDDATEFMVKMAENGSSADVVIMDPPRAGSTPEFIKSAVSIKPSRIVYVSCGPDTLARDLELFRKYHYNAQKIQPVDMFPWTSHIETVVLLTKEPARAKGKITAKPISKPTPKTNVKAQEKTTEKAIPKNKKNPSSKKKDEVMVDLDKMIIQGKKGKASYGEIKKFIMNEFGESVSTLNIGLTKDKLGIQRRPEYDPKDPYMPKVPAVKEAMIKEAFHYFNII